MVSNWKRILGLFIDLAVVDFIITKPLSKLVEGMIPKSIGSFNEVFQVFSLNKLFLISLIIGLLGVLYWSILEYNIGQTLGGLILNLKVRSVDNKKFNFSQVLLRNVTKISVLFLLLDSIHILFSPKKQRFFEKLSKTETVEKI